MKLAGATARIDPRSPDLAAAETPIDGPQPGNSRSVDGQRRRSSRWAHPHRRRYPRRTGLSAFRRKAAAARIAARRSAAKTAATSAE